MPTTELIQTLEAARKLVQSAARAQGIADLEGRLYGADLLAVKLASDLAAMQRHAERLREELRAARQDHGDN